MTAPELMSAFAERTGIVPPRPPRRYLWTDAFAVCTLIGLSRANGDRRLLETAVALVDQVHRVLGRHRPDGARTGWISGLADGEAEAHPTRGGLRIGKELPERGPDDPLEPGREWDRDGQYFHYLTKWMHALDQLAGATDEPKFHVWARELAAAAHRAFTYSAGGHRRMHWKMSVDLTRPQVPSMGQHDPLDGYITLLQLSRRLDSPGLAGETADLRRMMEGLDWETDDPLGLGGLLADAFRLHQLDGDRKLLAAILDAAASGLDDYLLQLPFDEPAESRLAFREFGLSIGLRAAVLMVRRDPPEVASLKQILNHAPLIERIELFWRDRRTHPGWIAHQDINDVMFATSLAPEGFLVLC